MPFIPPLIVTYFYPFMFYLIYLPPEAWTNQIYLTLRYDYSKVYPGNLFSLSFFFLLSSFSSFRFLLNSFSWISQLSFCITFGGYQVRSNPEKLRVGFLSCVEMEYCEQVWDSGTCDSLMKLLGKWLWRFMNKKGILWRKVRGGKNLGSGQFGFGQIGHWTKTSYPNPVRIINRTFWPDPNPNPNSDVRCPDSVVRMSEYVMWFLNIITKILCDRTRTQTRTRFLMSELDRLKLYL